jgi:hypothetical protein
MAKTNLSYMIFILILLSCGENEKKLHDETNSQDSATITALKYAEQERMKKDSIINEEQDKAIGNIPFYISKEQFNEEKGVFMNKCKLPKYEFYKNATIIENKIGGYGFNSIDGWFYKDSLYSVELHGCFIDYDKYDIVMPDQYNALMDLLKSKYGLPVIDNGFPSWTSIEKGYYRTCAIWEIGDKTIEARISCAGTDYTLNLCVFKPAIEILINKEGADKAKDEAEKGKSLI